MIPEKATVGFFLFQVHPNNFRRPVRMPWMVRILLNPFKLKACNFLTLESSPDQGMWSFAWGRESLIRFLQIVVIEAINANLDFARFVLGYFEKVPSILSQWMGAIIEDVAVVLNPLDVWEQGICWFILTAFDFLLDRREVHWVNYKILVVRERRVRYGDVKRWFWSLSRNNCKRG